MPFDDRRFSGVVMFTMLHHVPTVELQDAMFARGRPRAAPGGLFVASDGVARDELAALHNDDIYNPVDPGRSRPASRPPASRDDRGRGQRLRVGLPGPHLSCPRALPAR